MFSQKQLQAQRETETKTKTETDTHTHTEREIERETRDAIAVHLPAQRNRESVHCDQHCLFVHVHSACVPLDLAKSFFCGVGTGVHIFAAPCRQSILIVSLYRRK